MTKYKYILKLLNSQNNPSDNESGEESEQNEQHPHLIFNIFLVDSIFLNPLNYFILNF